MYSNCVAEKNYLKWITSYSVYANSQLTFKKNYSKVETW